MKRPRDLVVPVSALSLINLSLFTLPDGGVALFSLFSVALYISFKLKQHVKLIRAALPENLPPLPDPRIFGGSGPTAENAAQTVVDQNRVDYISLQGRN